MDKKYQGKSGYKGKGNGYKGNRGKGKQTGDIVAPNASTVGSDSMNKSALLYAQNPQILYDAASFSFATPLGGKFNISHPYGDAADYSIPGIMAIDTMLVPGISQNATSVLNIAARNIYSFVCHANAGHSNYDSPDLLLYLLAMDNLYAAHAWMCRVYGTMRFYLQTNRYMAKTLVEAQCVNFEDLEGQLADFRYYINQVAIKVGAMCVPNTMPYFVRHREIYSNIYMDAPNVKAQMYLYNPMSFASYVEMTESTTYGKLVMGAEMRGTGLHTLSMIKTLVDALINKVVVSEDLNIMSGDILKAFGNDNVFKIGAMSEDYEVMPVYDPVVLDQIHNIRLAGRYDDTFDIVSQDPSNGTLICQPQFKTEVAGAMSDIIFDVGMDNPSPVDVMNSSRGSIIANEELDNDDYFLVFYDSCGSEIFTRAWYYQFKQGPGPTWTALPIEIASNADDLSLLSSVCALSTFNQHPLINVWNTATELKYVGTLGSINNFTIMNKSDLRKMHECALLSLFNVPAMGTYSR